MTVCLHAIRNRFPIDQLVLYFERKPDEAQRSHVDWGFLFANLYGLDYHFTISRGILSSQVLRRNRIYGYDPVMFYLDFYIPWVFEGMNIRIGRYISVPDIEAQLAPQNPMFTHSILYNFDPFTQTGIITTTQINKNWRIQLGISASNDTAPWSKDAEPAGTLMFQWISNSNKDSLYFGANSFNDGLFHYNNLQMYVAQYNHKFNDVINTNFEGYYMYQRRVPDLPRSGKFSYAPEWGIVNYTFFRLARNTFLTVRNEYYNDKKGQRTGFPTYYTEHAIGITYWPNSIVTIRPEIRFDHAYQTKAYNNGTRRSQFMAAIDIIFHY